MTTETIHSTPNINTRAEQIKLGLKNLLPRLGDLIVNAVLQVRIWDKTYAGLMHLLLFGGVTIQVLGTIINLTQMALFIPFLELPFPRGAGYQIFELVMDIAGIAILLGVIMAAFRRFVLRPKTLESSWDDYYALIMLTMIPLVGFLTEGARLVATSPTWAAWSPAGSLVANIMRTAGITPASAGEIHRYFVFSHVVLGLALVASIPFTKMRHLIYTPLNIFFRPKRKSNTLEAIDNIEETDLLGVGKITEFTPHQLLSFDACVRCGRCEEVCPVAFSGMPYSPKNFIQNMRTAMQSGLVNPNGNGHGDAELIGSSIPEETPWYCTTCGACLDRCPAFVNPVDDIIDLRRYQVLTTGKMPKSIGDVMRNMERQGNPWGMPPEDRISWMSDLEVNQLEPGDEVEVLLYLGCASAYDERNKKVARSIIQILNQAGVDYGVLGLDEMCCGETARRLGHEYLYQMMVEQNIEVFNSVKFQRIVTNCPHCFNTLKNEYPQFGGEFVVQHLTEFLSEISFVAAATIQNGKQLTFHDSCYLGRYNHVYTQPRNLLSQSKLNWVEMDRSSDNSFCCGGGGGQMWMETDANTRINHRRLADALDTGAQIVATACPYCLLMFDDAIRSKGMGETIEVMDVAEILVSQMESGN